MEKRGLVAPGIWGRFSTRGSSAHLSGEQAAGGVQDLIPEPRQLSSAPGTAPPGRPQGRSKEQGSEGVGCLHPSLWGPADQTEAGSTRSREGCHCSLEPRGGSSECPGPPTLRGSTTAAQPLGPLAQCQAPRRAPTSQEEGLLCAGRAGVRRPWASLLPARVTEGSTS